MEKNETSQEPNMRLNIKQTAKGDFYGEYTVRADSIEELEARSKEVSDYMLKQLKELNGG